jgi:hypothetical protein
LLCVDDINAQVKCWLYISAKEIALPLKGDRDQEVITPTISINLSADGSWGCGREASSSVYTVHADHPPLEIEARKTTCLILLFDFRVWTLYIRLLQ